MFNLRYSCMGLVAVLLGVSAAANADTVAYSTFGYFGSSPGTSIVSSGGETLSFTGVTDLTVDTPSIASLGEFTPLFGADGSTGAFTGDTFTLTILNDQTDVSQSITGTLTGSLASSSSGSPSSSVYVNFGGQSADFIAGNGDVLSFAPFGTPVGNSATTVQGNVTATSAAAGSPPVTPLPKTVFAGLAC
jgi:hypothetical protein